MARFLATAVLAVCSLPGRADELEKLLRRPPSPGLSRWSYAPATYDGRPVRGWLTVTVSYRLG